MKQSPFSSIVYVLAVLGISAAAPVQAQVEALAGTWSAMDDANYSLYGPVSIDEDGTVEFTESFTLTVNGEDIFFWVTHTGRIFLDERNQISYVGDADGSSFGLQGEVELGISVTASGIASQDLNTLALVWSTVDTYAAPANTNTIESSHPLLLFRDGAESGAAAEDVAGVWDVTLTGNTVDWNGTVVIDPSGAMTGEYVSLAAASSSLAGLGSFSEPGEFRFEYTTVTDLPIIGESTFTLLGEGQANDERTVITGEWEFAVVTETGVVETFRGTFVFTKADLPELAVRDFVLTDEVVFLPLANVGMHLELEAVNRGTQSVGPFSYAFYLSNDRRVTVDDWLLPGGRGHYDGVIAPGESVLLHVTDSMTMPAEWASGQQYLSVILDESDEIAEANENNNVAMIPIWVLSPSELLPDLTPFEFALDVRPVFAPGDKVGPHLNVLIANEGLEATTDFFVSLYLSFDDVLSDGDASLQGARELIDEPIPAGHEIPFAFRDMVGLPGGLNPGVYYLGIVVDETDDVFESDEENNIRWIEIEVVSPGDALPDLLPLRFEFGVERRFAPGDPIGPHLEALIANEGLSESAGFFVSLYLSFDDGLSDGDAQLLGARQFIEEAISAGHERFVTFSEHVSLPNGLNPGVYYVGIAVDETDLVGELNEENNTAWIQIEVTGEQTSVTDWIDY